MKLRKLENIAVIAFIIFSLVLTIIPNRVSAADTTLYLGIVEKRDTEEFGYAISDPNHGGSKLWRILEYQGLNSTALKTNGKKNIYCLREGFGFSDTKKKAEYNLKFDMKTQRDDISKESTELAKTVTNSSYNELLALGDLLYLFGSTSAEREAYLEAAGISKGTFWDVMITDGDIEAVHQAAI